MYFLPTNSIFNLKFLYYFFKNIKNKLIDSSTAIPSLRRNDIYSLHLILPPLNEQKRIVQKIESIFTQIDAAKEDLDNVKVVLKQNKQAVLKQAFEGKLTEKWRLTNKNNHTIKKQILKQISDELKLMKKNPVYIFGTLQKKDLFKIPTDWIWARLMNISQIGQGGTPSTKNKDYWDGKISWLRSGEIRNNYIYKSENYISDVGLTNSSTIMCPQETVLLAMTGQGLTRGRCAILKINACANQSVAHMILDHNRAFNKFLFYYLRFQYWRIRSVSKGSNQAGLNVSIIKQFDVPLPPIPEQKRIVQKIESIFARIDAIEKQVGNSLIKLDLLKKSILKKAFEGKLVPQDPNDEPASVLLAKIKQEKSHKQKKYA